MALSLRNIATLILGLIWLMLTVLATPGFVGSDVLLACYSLLFFALVLDCLWRPVGMGYFFLVSFVTLGFWVKLLLHLWLGYDYLEPTGLSMIPSVSGIRYFWLPCQAFSDCYWPSS